MVLKFWEEWVEGSYSVTNWKKKCSVGNKHSIYSLSHSLLLGGFQLRCLVRAENKILLDYHFEPHYDGQKWSFLRIILPCASRRIPQPTYSWEPGQGTPPTRMQPRCLIGQARVLRRGGGMCVLSQDRNLLRVNLTGFSQVYEGPLQMPR